MSFFAGVRGRILFIAVGVVAVGALVAALLIPGAGPVPETASPSVSTTEPTAADSPDDTGTSGASPDGDAEHGDATPSGDQSSNGSPEPGQGEEADRIPAADTVSGTDPGATGTGDTGGASGGSNGPASPGNGGAGGVGNGSDDGAIDTGGEGNGGDDGTDGGPADSDSDGNGGPSSGDSNDDTGNGAANGSDGDRGGATGPGASGGNQGDTPPNVPTTDPGLTPGRYQSTTGLSDAEVAAARGTVLPNMGSALDRAQDPELDTTGGWRFVPDTLLLAPGETTTVRLVRFDGDGNPTTDTPTGSLAIRQTNSAVASIAPSGGNAFTVTATGGGATVAAVDIDMDRPAALAVTVAGVADDVVLLGDGVIAFPVAAATNHGAAGPWYRDNGVGLFTWAEIQARISGVGTGNDDGPDYAAFRYPVITVDLAFGEGAKLMGSAGSGVLGVAHDVVTRTGGGHSFTIGTMELVSPLDFFNGIDVHIDGDDLAAIGLMPDDSIVSDSDDPQPLRSAGRAFVSTAPAAVTSFLTDGDSTPVKSDNKECKAALSASAFTVSTDLYGSVKGRLDADIVDADRPVFVFRFEVTPTIGVRGGISGQPKAAVTVTCTLWKAPAWDIPAPLPIGPFLTAQLTPKVDFVFEASASAPSIPSLSTSYDCHGSVTIAIGAQWDAQTGFTSLNDFDYDGKCDPPEANDGVSSSSGIGPAAELQISTGLDFGVDFAAQLGGKVAAWISRWFFEHDGIGAAQLADAKVSLRMGATWDSDGMVAVSGKSSTSIGATLGASIGVKASFLLWILKMFAPQEELGELSWPIAQINPPINLVELYHALNAKNSELALKAGDDLVSDQFVVSHGTSIEVRSPMTATEGGLDLGGIPDVVGVDAYIKPPDGFDWTPLKGVTYEMGPSSSDTEVMVVTKFTATPEVCQMATGDTYAQVLVLPRTRALGLPTAAFGGTFHFRCAEPKLSVTPSSISHSATEMDGKTTVTDPVKLTLRDRDALSEGFDGAWTLTDTLPEWLTITNKNQTGMSGGAGGSDGAGQRLGDKDRNGQSFGKHMIGSDLDVRVQCVEDKHYTASVTFQVADTSLTSPLTTSLSVDVDCSGTYLDWPKSNGDPGGASPGPLTVPARGTKTATLTLVTRGGESAIWSTGSDMAVEFTPASGELAAGKSTFHFDVRITDIRDVSCVDQPAYSRMISVGAVGRGSQSVRVDFARIPARCQPVKQDLDPHMTSFDGLRYDNFLLGEFVYVEPDPDAVGYDPDNPGPRIVARQELTHPEAVAADDQVDPNLNQRRLLPTSITAASVEINGHTIEYYVRPVDTLIVDGVTQDLSRGFATDLGDDVQLTVSSKALVQVVAPQVWVQFDGVENWWLDLSVGVPDNAPIRGFLGNRDGNAANDLTRGPRPVTETYGNATACEGITRFELNKIREGKDHLICYGESWRLHDLAESPFSLGYDGFNAVALPFDPDLIDEFTDQARGLVSGAQRVCTGLNDDYLITQIAWEVGIGTDPARMGGIVCNYRMTGTVTVESDDGSPQPLSGVTVTITSPTLATCTTTTSTAGAYSCTTIPDLADNTPGDPAPPTVHVAVSWTDEGTSIADGDFTYSAMAKVGQTVSGALDVTVPASAVPLLTVHGTLHSGGAVVPGPVSVWMTPLDADGAWVAGASGTMRVTVAADGTFTVTRSIAPTAARVFVQLERYGTPRLSRAVTLDVSGGTYEFDWDAKARSVTFTGSLTWAGDLVTAPNRVSIRLSPLTESGAPAGSAISASVTPGADGQFSYTSEIPDATAKVTVELNGSSGTAVRVSKTFALQPTVANDIGPWNAVGEYLLFDGSITGMDGTVLAGGSQVALDIDFRDAAGYSISSSLALSTTVNAAGRIPVTIALPDGVASVRMWMGAGNRSTATLYEKIFTLTGTSPYHVVWDLAPDSVTATGTLTWGDHKLAVGEKVFVSVYPVGADGYVIGQINGSGAQQTITLDEKGEFSLTAPLVEGAVKVRVTAYPDGEVNGRPSMDIPLTGEAPYEVRADLAQQLIEVTATPTWDGASAQRIWLAGTAYDASGHRTETYSSNRVTLDAGIATSTFPWDPAIASVAFTVSDDDPGTGGSFTTASIPVAAPPAGSNVTHVAFTDGTRHVTITGAYSVEGTPKADVHIRVDFALKDADGNWSSYYDRYNLPDAVETDENGTFDLDQFLVMERYTGLRVTFHTPAGDKVFVADPLDPGTPSYVFDIDVTGQQVTVTVPAAHAPESVEIIAHEWQGESGGWAVSDPIPMLRDDSGVVYLVGYGDPQGDVVFTAMVSGEATLVTVVQHFSDGHTMTTHQPIVGAIGYRTLGGSTTFELPYLAPGGTQLHLTGTTDCSSDTNSQCYREGLSIVGIGDLYAPDGDTGADPDSNADWPLLFGDIWVIPDPVTHQFVVDIPVPAGVTDAKLDFDEWTSPACVSPQFSMTVFASGMDGTYHPIASLRPQYVGGCAVA